jgi:glycosyltransferase involved in cell wall biosynthesis
MPSTPYPGKQRILHFASGDLWGGAEAVVYTLIREQQRRDAQGVACVLMNPGQLADRLAELGVRTLVLDESRQGVMALATQAGKFARDFNPTVFHAHRRKENFVALIAALRGAPKVARVTTVHGMPEPVATGNGIKRRIGEFINGLMLSRGYDAVVAVSRDIQLRMRILHPRAQVMCVYNGIDRLDSANGDDVLAATNPLRLLALGRLVPIKRFDRLAEISDALTATGTFARITLAGDGPLRNELVKNLRSRDRTIDMPGFVPDPAELFAFADALLITSDHEGIPMVALEALARGIPVFGFSVGGLPEIANGEVPMTLVAPGDCGAMARAIESHFADGRSRRRFPPAEWKFGIVHCADEYERVYAGVAVHSTDAREP